MVTGRISIKPRRVFLPDPPATPVRRHSMVQVTSPVEPFGEVNVFKENGKISVKATVLMVPDVENARTGLALDASASMKDMYGVSRLVNPIFGAATHNVVEPVARTMCGFLANFSSAGKCHLLYWACAPDGSGTEAIGEFTADEVASVAINGPKGFPWGRQTRLLSPVKYFAEGAFDGVPWSMAVIITDGVIDDLADVKAYCLGLAQQMVAGQRGFLKFVLIGLGSEVDEGQMEELDDMFEGSGLVMPDGNQVDLWDHKLASDMSKLEQIFSEVVDERMIVVASGRVTDSSGQVVREYNGGVPAVLRFDLAQGATAFTLEFPGGQVTQDISEALGRI